MGYSKLQNLTIKNKQFFRDGGLYIYSPTDGYLELDADTEYKMIAPTIKGEATTLIRLKSATVEVSGAAFRRRAYQYMSGTADAGWTSTLWDVEYPTLPDEGIIFLSAKNGNIGAKLPATPIRGATLDVVFTDSGSAIDGAKTLILSGNICYQGNDAKLMLAYMTFSRPGQSVSFVGTENPAYWWCLTPSGAGAPGITTRG